MKSRAWAALGGALLLAGCGATKRNSAEGMPPEGGAGTGMEPAPVSCQPPAPALVRLSFVELADSARDLLSDELGDQLTQAAVNQGLSSARTFPLLASPDEGPVIDDLRLATTDAFAQLAGKYVREHFAALTGCDADYGCVRDYVAGLAEQAFRRPLTAEEMAALLLVVDRAEALDAGAETAAEYGAYAVFESPHFLYRTEFGVPSGNEPRELALTGYELASQLSYLLTGRGPDAALRVAAEAGMLSSAAGLAGELERLVQTPVAELHLSRVLQSYFGTWQVDNVVLGAPEWTVSLRQAARAELDELLAQASRSGPIALLLSSRRARVNADLSAIYGLTFPSASADASGFAQVELPEARAGILTRSGWAAMTSTPDGPRLLQRAQWIRSVLLCGPPLPLETPHPLDMGGGDTPRERVEYRLTHTECRDCHRELDPFGLAVDDLDALGRFRSQDGSGNPIDASARLPGFAGGAEVRGAAALSLSLPPAAFTTCLSQRLLEYAASQPVRVAGGGGCVLETPAGDDDSLADILRHVVESEAFRVRSL